MQATELLHGELIAHVEALTRVADCPVHFDSLSQTIIGQFKEDVTFGSVADALPTWGIDAVVLEVGLENLSELPMPVLALCNVDESGESDRKGRQYMLVCAVEGNQVAYLDESWNTVWDTVETLRSRWSTKALGVAIDEQSGQQDYLERRAISDRQRDGYKDEIVVIPNWLSEESCDALIQLAQPTLERSKVEGRLGKMLSDRRTSRSSELDSEEALVRALEDKVLELEPNKTRAHLERPQVVCYQPGQEFDAHFDALPGKLEREKTYLVYLNDEFEGGETEFPFLNLNIGPQKGQLLGFRNYTDSHVERYSLHAGLPVTQGEKYVANIWVRAEPIASRLSGSPSGESQSSESSS